VSRQDLYIEHEAFGHLHDDGGRYGLSWRGEAACKGMDTRLFFPVGRSGEAPDTVAEAKRVCVACPVRASCLAFALTTNQQFGIWGGCDEDDLLGLRRERRAQRRRRLLG
jgi:WhiB family redox-sensing transcriptional regulator